MDPTRAAASSIEHLRESIENLRRILGARAPKEVPASGAEIRFHVLKAGDRLPPRVIDVYLQTAELSDRLAAARLSRESRLKREAQTRVVPQPPVDDDIVPMVPPVEGQQGEKAPG